MAMVNKGIKFSDIFNVQPYNKGCPSGYKAISKRDNGRSATCLQLKVRGCCGCTCPQLSPVWHGESCCVPGGSPLPGLPQRHRGV